MSKKALGIIIGCNTVISGAIMTCVSLIWPDRAPIVNGVIEVVSGCINGICLVFLKDEGSLEKIAK